MNRLIIAGSPRTNGRSAALANQLFEACIEDCPQDEVTLAPVATLAIEGCQGCGGCRREASGDTDAAAGSNVRVGAENDISAEVFVEGDLEAESSASERNDEFRCCLEDDMQDLYPLIEAADELVVVSPVYFAGPPAQLKALLDRLQPYYWIRQRGKRGGAKRPATLHVVGEGGDPHGFEPLVGTVRSALACAGFALESVYDWVGKINEDGEITAEAAAYPLASPLKTGTAEEPSFASGDCEHVCPLLESQSSLQAISCGDSVSPVKRERPRLRLAEEKPASSSQGRAKQQARESKPQSKHSGSGQNHSKGGGRQTAKHMQGKRSSGKQSNGKQSKGKQPKGERRG